MGRRVRERRSATAHLAVTLLGITGFLGFLMAARMDDANASPFDVIAFSWFFAFGTIKLCLPWCWQGGLSAAPRPARRSDPPSRTTDVLSQSPQTAKVQI
jgi:hypothetical protein